ncbi:MAG: sigma 54-interacting transcriptional regulator [Hyphomonadaceae bacterium]|nr:sigma 54-interacting transcriptional regulator [Hyphomonadaceae bacterium]MBC6413063.1 sigma 54-interacting transcriptional regulator [Hyphomonadaceae bacterium]
MAAIPPQLIGESPEFLALLDWVSDVASLNGPVLIIGERGTGKELIASRLHFLSPRWEQAYRYVNCAAYDRDTFEWIIYGGEGLEPILADVNGGTLILDNVDALAKTSQARLVRVMEYNEFDSLDGQGARSVDIRFIASTCSDPVKVVADGRISADFLDGAAVNTVHLPPLRVRKDDIVPLTVHFGRKTVSTLGAEHFPGFTPEATGTLLSHDWPGNIRELKNTVDRSVARAFLADENLIQPVGQVIFDVLTSPWVDVQSSAPSPAGTITALEQPQPDNTNEPETTDFTARVMAFERTLIDQALNSHNHHQGRAAENLGLSYHQFRGLLRKHGLKK